ncbi:hypothetical protein [Francisella philomiragia]|uniref:hypothetical protein n=1 Tax=Francisella philomiragia TaxID=28110 RepID=UPI00224375FA|nr:hypothetical protein [Francisella philomiragia]
MNLPTYTKKLTETYTIKGENCLWAKVNLDINKESVNVFISSDYGEYSNYWSSCGLEPKKFLSTLNKSYILKKFLTRNELNEPDWDQRLKSCKQQIIDDRRDQEVDAQIARAAWDELLDLFDDYNGSEDIYWHTLTNNYYLSKIFHDWEYIPEETKISHKAELFYSDVWLPFEQVLIHELNSLEG